MSGYLNTENPPIERPFSRNLRRRDVGDPLSMHSKYTTLIPIHQELCFEAFPPFFTLKQSIASHVPHPLDEFDHFLSVSYSKQSVDRKVFIDQRPVNAVSGR